MPGLADEYDTPIVTSAPFIILPVSGIAVISGLKDDVYIGEPGVEDSFITALLTDGLANRSKTLTGGPYGD